MPLLTGYAQWWEVIVIFIGLGLVAFEIFVFPGHGVAAVVGVLMIFVGLLATFVGSEPAGPGWLPTMSGTWTNLRNGLVTITIGFALSMLLSAWLRRFLPRIPFFNRLILTTTSGETVDQNQRPVPPSSVSVIDAANVWPGVGTRGKAATDLRPGGSAEFFDFARGDNRAIAVVSENGYVERGKEVIVRKANGNRVVVQVVNA